MKIGIVIGHYDQLDALKLNLAAIRAHCGETPVLVSDDCSPGFCNTPLPGTVFHQVLELQQDPLVRVWPNVERIGHTGGDCAAYWKGIVWGAALGLDVVFKLSHRLIIDIPGWHESSAKELAESGMAACGGWCSDHNWIRTEAMGLMVKDWNSWGILSHLTPRKINCPVEKMIAANLNDRLDNRFHRWSIFTATRRRDKSPNILFYPTASAQDYLDLAERLGVGFEPAIDTRPSPRIENYLKG